MGLIGPIGLIESKNSFKEESFMALVKPHGKKKKLMPLLLEGAALQKELKKAKTLKQLRISSRETADLVMMGIGAFTPLTGFMGRKDWKGVCDKYKLADGTFWPVTVTLSATPEFANGLKKNEEISLVDDESNEIMATMKVTEKYSMSKADKEHECKQILRTVDVAGHPGVQKVMSQPEFNLAGPVKVLSEGHFPVTYKGIYMTPKQTRKIFEEKGWSKIAAFQTRNPCTAPMNIWPRLPSRPWTPC
jgi:sulfate adenylyltransferase